MSRYFHLPAAHVFSATGRDIVRFLNARLSNNIRDLPVLHGCMAAALSAQGRTEGLFHVLRIEPERFLLTCDGGEPAELAAVLLRFKVADRVEIGIAADFRVVHLIGPGLPGSAGSVTALDGGWQVSRRRSDESGSDFIVQDSAFERLTGRWRAESATELSAAEAELLRLKGGLPEFPRELNSSMLFSESERRDAVSFTKGCYVGQEVVEKIDSHGRTAFTLRRIIAEGGGIAPEAEILAPPGEDATPPRAIGSVLSSAFDADEGRTYGFARIRDSAAGTGAGAVNGIPCRLESI